MADRELSNALSSGELSNIQLGGTSTDERLLTQAEINAVAAAYVKLDGTTSVAKITLTPTDPVTVPYVESTTYYNDETGTFDVKGKYSDVTLQVGREQHVEILNNSGAGFFNGNAVRYDSVAAGDPAVVLALADTFENASGFGVCTHDIPYTGVPANDKGIVTTFGRVGGLDLSSFSDGDILYLSDTVPGGFTTTPPDIATRIGIVFNNDAVNGELFVNPQINTTLPPVLGLLQGQNAPIYNLTTTAQHVDGYSSSGSVVMGVDPITGEITAPKDGYYNGTLTLAMSFASASQTRTVYIELYETTSMSVLFTFPVNIPRDATEDGTSFSAKVLATVGDIFVIRLRSTPDMTITLNSVSMDMESVRI